MTSSDCMVHISSDYALNLLSCLYAQLETAQFCDLTLDVAGQCFSVHRNILAAASPYFSAMLTGGLAESEKNTVHIHGTTPTVFNNLIKFMYTGAVDIDEDTCQEILAAADLFNLSGVVDACCLFLEQNLIPANCLGIYQLADVHSCKQLKTRTEQFICTHFTEVIREEEFLNLSKDILTHLLASEHLQIGSEIEVISAALKWLNHDVSQRRTAVFKVFSNIRFPLVPKQELDKCLEACQDLSIKVAVASIALDFNWRSPNLANMNRMRKEHPYRFQVRKGARRRLMIIGGCNKTNCLTKWQKPRDLQSVEIFDTYSMKWKPAASLSNGRSSHGTVFLNGMVYVFGGEYESLIYDDMECYDISNDKWMTAPSMTSPRCGHGSAVVDDVIYAFGGWVGSEMGKSMEAFYLASNTWQEIGEMTSARYNMGVTSYEGMIYVCGGIGDTGISQSSTECYNPQTNRWHRLSNMQRPRSSFGLCAANGTLYAVGGRSKNGDLEGEPLSTIECYDIEMNKWIIVTSMTAARPEVSCACLSGLLYVFGGLNHYGFTSSSADCFDLETHCWINLEPLSMSRSMMGISIL